MIFAMQLSDDDDDDDDDDGSAWNEIACVENG